MLYLSKSPKVFLLVLIGILAISNVSVICLNSVRPPRANMRVICFQEKAFRLISIRGIIQTNRLDLIKTSRLISLVLYPVLGVHLLHSISPVVLHTSKPTIFTILVQSMVNWLFLTSIHIKFKSVQN